MLSVIAVAERRRILTVLRVHHNRGEGTSIEPGPDPPCPPFNSGSGSLTTDKNQIGSLAWRGEEG